MKIQTITGDVRKREFRLVADGREFTFPWARLRLVPSADDPLASVQPEPETGCEAFTYVLESGAEDTVHMDSVLYFNRDPEYMQRLLMYELTLKAMDAVEASGLGKRQLARQLGTSPSQLYRLLDPTNYNKSVGQMLAILNMAGRKVTLQVEEVGPA